MGDYNETTTSYETEVGTVDIIQMWDDDSKLEEFTVEVYVNRRRMYVPNSNVKQDDAKLIQRAIKTVKAGQGAGLTKGIFEQTEQAITAKGE